MNGEYITDIIRELKTELYNVQKSANALSLTDASQLYYNGVAVGLQKAIGKYEQWYRGQQPPKDKKKGKGNKKQCTSID